MPTSVFVKTWICPNCPFRWQFQGEAVNVSPYDLTDRQLQQQYPEPQYVGLSAGKCPNCFAHGQSSPLGLSIETSEMSQVNVADDATLEAIQVPDLDANGQQIMEQTGSHYELRVNQTNGAISSVEVPDYAPKMRPLTDQELADLKLQRNQNLDALAPVTVSETTA